MARFIRDDPAFCAAFRSNDAGKIVVLDASWFRPFLFGAHRPHLSIAVPNPNAGSVHVVKKLKIFVHRDLFGKERFRTAAPYLVRETRGIIVVLDASDSKSSSNINLLRRELHKLLDASEEMRIPDACVLVFLNTNLPDYLRHSSNDSDSAKSPMLTVDDVADALGQGLDNSIGRPWLIQPAVIEREFDENGPGMPEGFEWLSRMVQQQEFEFPSPARAQQQKFEFPAFQIPRVLSSSFFRRRNPQPLSLSTLNKLEHRLLKHSFVAIELSVGTTAVVRKALKIATLHLRSARVSARRSGAGGIDGLQEQEVEDSTKVFEKNEATVNAGPGVSWSSVETHWADRSQLRIEPADAVDQTSEDWRRFISDVPSVESPENAGSGSSATVAAAVGGRHRSGRTHEEELNFMPALGAAWHAMLVDVADQLPNLVLHGLVDPGSFSSKPCAASSHHIALLAARSVMDAFFYPPGSRIHGSELRDDVELTPAGPRGLSVAPHTDNSMLTFALSDSAGFQCRDAVTDEFNGGFFPVCCSTTSSPAEQEQNDAGIDESSVESPVESALVPELVVILGRNIGTRKFDPDVSPCPFKPCEHRVRTQARERCSLVIDYHGFVGGRE